MTDFEIVNADVMKWAREYDGPKFHACFCDPSYALSKKKAIDRDAPANLGSDATIQDVIDAYHSIQQWGDAGFMQKNWDSDICFDPRTWAALSQHLHPGAFLLAFGSTRGWHRLACAIEDAGFLIQPSVFVHGVGVVDVPGLIYHITGQSFPKSTRIDKALDKRAGAERRVVGKRVTGRAGTRADKRNANDGFESGQMLIDVEEPATPLARAWAGHRYGGQILKDMALPIVVAQKPWEGKRLDCIVETGAGSLWVDGARVATGGEAVPYFETSGGKRKFAESSERHGKGHTVKAAGTSTQGRWPPNYVVTHHPLCTPVTVPAPCPACGGDSGGYNDGEFVERQLNEHRYRAPATVTCPYCGNEFEHAKEGNELNTTHGIRYVMAADLLTSVFGSEVKCHGCGERFDVDYEPVEDGLLTALVRDRSGGEPCETCGGSGEVEVGAVERVKSGIYVGHNLDQADDSTNAVYGKYKQDANDASYANDDGQEQVTRYRCARHCAGCGCWWLSETADVCAECGEVGEWGCSVRLLDEQAGESGPSFRTGDRRWNVGLPGERQKVKGTTNAGYTDRGGPSRYFPTPDFSHETAERLALGQTRKYCAKSSRAERDAGLEEMLLVPSYMVENGSKTSGNQTGKRYERKTTVRNPHPCIKPITLTKWLASLLLPPDIYAPRRLLVPFFGTGSEGIGAALTGWEHVTGIEMSEEYCQIAEARTRFWTGWSAHTGETEVKPILKAAKKVQREPGQTPQPPTVTEPVAEQLAMETMA